jgi:hypothetical protein
VVIRFEHMQPVAAAGVEPLLIGGTNQSFLSDAAWAVLQHRLSLFLIGRVLTLIWKRRFRPITIALWKRTKVLHLAPQVPI